MNYLEYKEIEGYTEWQNAIAAVQKEKAVVALKEAAINQSKNEVIERLIERVKTFLLQKGFDTDALFFTSTGADLEIYDVKKQRNIRVQLEWKYIDPYTNGDIKDAPINIIRDITLHSCPFDFRKDHHRFAEILHANHLCIVYATLLQEADKHLNNGSSEVFTAIEQAGERLRELNIERIEINNDLFGLKRKELEKQNNFSNEFFYVLKNILSNERGEVLHLSVSDSMMMIVESIGDKRIKCSYSKRKEDFGNSTPKNEKSFNGMKTLEKGAFFTYFQHLDRVAYSLV